MATYDEAKAAVFARATVPDGYFGDRRTVGLAIIDNHVMCVADCGFFRSGINANSPAEAVYMIKNHPLQYRNDNITLID